MKFSLKKTPYNVGNSLTSRNPPRLLQLRGEDDVFFGIYSLDCPPGPRMQSSPPGFLNMFRFRDPNLNLHLPRTIASWGPGVCTSNPSFKTISFPKSREPSFATIASWEGGDNPIENKILTTKRLSQAKLQRLALQDKE